MSAYFSASGDGPVQPGSQPAAQLKVRCDELVSQLAVPDHQTMLHVQMKLFGLGEEHTTPLAVQPLARAPVTNALDTAAAFTAVRIGDRRSPWNAAGSSTGNLRRVAVLLVWLQSREQPKMTHQAAATLTVLAVLNSI
jgi:hypothetical protein